MISRTARLIIEILDRIIHIAYQVNLEGESQRTTQAAALMQST
jgi:hypothetical protein